jgi:Cof subfamily protein (haloacid dehalogenase superfamily)
MLNNKKGYDKMYKMFVTDLDDTLLSSDSTISRKNKDALKYMYDRGIKIVIASGRITLSIKRYINELKANGIEVEHIIAYNGALTLETSNYSIIDKRIVNTQLCKEIIELARENEIVVQVYVNDYVYVEVMNSYVDGYMKIDGIKVLKVDDLIKLVEENRGSFKLLLNDNNDRLQIIKDNLQKKYVGELDIFFSKECYLEMVNIETNKGLALRRLAGTLGIDMSEVIAVGDGQNDRAMIEYAGLGCLMINGEKDITSVANYITQNDNNNSAIAEIAYKFIK